MRCVIAGGGTGGHLFPGIAIAEAFLEREEGNRVLFVGTERGIESRLLQGERFPLMTIHARPLKGKSFQAKAQALLSLPVAVQEAHRILRSFRPHIVLGVGGYASGPTLVAAVFTGTSRAIHEQNVVPGMTNRLLRWISQLIFVSFEETTPYFPKGKTRVTGTPVRQEVIFRVRPGQEGRGISGIDEAGLNGGNRFTVFILGGSAGAHRLNGAMQQALEYLEDIKSSLRIIHQTGRQDVDVVSQAYTRKGFEATVRPFFDDVTSCYRMSDLVISRAGASTIAELAICGKAAILVPYPYAAHRHQVLNAQKLVDRGAARMILDDALNGAAIAQMIRSIYEEPEERTRLEEAMREGAHPAAAREIVDYCYALVGRRHTGSGSRSRTTFWAGNLGPSTGR